MEGDTRKDILKNYKQIFMRMKISSQFGNRARERRGYDLNKDIILVV